MIRVKGWWVPHDHHDVPKWIDVKEKLEQHAYPNAKGKTLAVDAGAFIGATAIALSEHFDKVIAFEPARESFSCLVANVRERAEGKVICLPVALSHYTGIVRMSGDIGPSMCIAKDGGGNALALSLDLLGLEPDFTKMDLEGHEGCAIYGARETLAKCPLLMVENKPQYRKRYVCHENMMIQLLDLGFKRIAQSGHDEIHAR